MYKDQMKVLQNKVGKKIPSYQNDSYDHVQSSFTGGNISDDEEEHGQRKVAEGLGRIKESYNDIKSVYAQDSNISP